MMDMTLRSETENHELSRLHTCQAEPQRHGLRVQAAAHANADDVAVLHIPAAVGAHECRNSS